MQSQKILSILIVLLYYFTTATICWQGYLERVEVPYVNPDFITKPNVTLIKYNRTTFALNVYGEVLQDISNNALVQIKLCGLYSNTYKELPLMLRRNICDFFKNEYQWIKREIHGHYPSRCPVKKGTYYFNNFIMNTEKFPSKPWSTDYYFFEAKLITTKEQFVIKLYFRTSTNDELKYNK